MENPAAADRQRIDSLLTNVAGRLMTISALSAPAEIEAVLKQLLDCFGAETTFLRRHNLASRRTQLVARQAAPGQESTRDRTSTAALDAEIDMHFDGDPRLAVTENQTTPLITFSRRPDSAPAGDDPYGPSARRDGATGPDPDGRTLTTIPLIRSGSTIGILGFVHAGVRRWLDDELRTLSAIAMLLAFLWDRTDAEEQFARQLNFDDLTGLPNHRKLTEALASLDDRRPASLLVLDIDNMKVINDGLDFETGNQFIAGLAQRLTSVVRPPVLIARLSGDQFAILILDTPTGQVERLAQRLVNELGETLRINEISIARSVSIGVAHNHIAESNGDLLAEADAALHQAKQQGKKRIAIFDEDMRTRVTDRFEVEIELRQAIERDELTLHYQPEVNLDTGEICAVEALLRWNHPRRGLLSAGVFIETAEESGLVVEIGDAVLRQAISQLANWQDDHPALEMWINVSPAQLMSRDLATQIQQLVDEFGVNADRLCLEVTEHVMLGDLDATTGVLRRLRRMGVKLALDDFGTGYSSMKQLKQLPIDTLKIDMTFVAGLGISDHDSAIVDAAITLAAAFGLGTVAEGVETQQQIAELRKRGCGHAQGYLLARPGPPETVTELLRNPLEIALLA